MKRHFIGLFLLNFIFSITFSQNLSISGLVINSETGAPIPWAHISTKNKAIGTVSNIEGGFQITIPFDSLLSELQLSISCMSFKDKSVMIPQKTDTSLKIFLYPGTILMEEAVIEPLNLRKMILAAVQKIPLNYFDKQSLITGFYRESLRFDNAKFIYLSEGVLEVIKSPYYEKANSGQVKLIKARKKQFPDSLDINKKIRFYAGPHIIHRRDFVLAGIEFINPKRMKNYDYEVENFYRINDRDIVRISFKPKNNQGAFQGTLTLDLNSLSFLSANYFLTETALRRENLTNFNSYFVGKEFLINYMSVMGKLAIQNIYQKSYLATNETTNPLIYTNEFISTNIDTSKVASFAYSDLIQTGDFFIEEGNNLDSNFWGNYNILKEDSFIRKIQDKEANQISQSTNFSDSNENTYSGELSLIRNLTLSIDIGAALVFFKDEQSTVEIDVNGQSLSTLSNRSSNPNFGLYSSFNLVLSPKFSAFVSATSTLSKLNVENVNLGFGYKHKFNLSSRPLEIVLGIEFSRNTSKILIGSIPGPLVVDNRRLSGEIDINAKKHWGTLQPSIKSALEINANLDLFLKFDYDVSLYQKNFLIFEEKNGNILSRKRSKINTSTSNYNFRVNGDITQEIPIKIYPYSVCLGFTFKFK